MNPLDELTKQEYIVLALVAKGRRNADIASELVISIRTVESHLRRIFLKLDVSTRTEAARRFYQFNSRGSAKLRGIAQDGSGHKSYA